MISIYLSKWVRE